ncbi:MAG: flagellar biosynthetic protein FliO [Nitrospinaceae bacterium]|nr:MAG: flagellar biosynthetic protein FliO [Nitrospinaceae bacterium]
MKFINRLILFALVSLWGASTVTIALAQDGFKNPLKDVSIDSQEDELVVRLEFAKPVLGELRPVFVGGAVEIDIPDAEARLDRLYYPTGDEVMRKVFVTRQDERTLRVQLPLGVEPGESRPVTIEKQGRAVVLTVEKWPAPDVLGDLLNKTREEVNAPVPSTAVSKPPAQAEAPLALPREAAKKTPVRFSDPAEEELPLEILPSSLKMLSMLALVLGLMFILFYGFKKFVLKGTPFGRYDRWMRVLGTSFLGPKKSIALVEVAGEVLVLGMANDNISLLSRIDDPEKIERITSGAPPARREDTQNGNGHPAQNGNGRAVKGEESFDGLLKQAAVSSKDKYVRDVTDQIRRKMEKIRPQ